jgi:hypothetical protein
MDIFWKLKIVPFFLLRKIGTHPFPDFLLGLPLFLMTVLIAPAVLRRFIPLRV